MKTVSLKLDNSISEELDLILLNFKMSRNRYINEAIVHFNNIQRQNLLEVDLLKESNLVRKESMEVLNEFSEIEYAD
jgi:predicted transcriptional regulator